jgi:hypothetical protein
MSHCNQCPLIEYISWLLSEVCLSIVPSAFNLTLKNYFALMTCAPAGIGLHERFELCVSITLEGFD